MAKTIRVKLLRGAFVNGERQKKGAELDVPSEIAGSLIHSGKAALVGGAPARSAQAPAPEAAVAAAAPEDTATPAAKGRRKASG